VSSKRIEDDIPSGFESSGFVGRYLEEGGPFYLKQEQDSCAVGLRISEQHINYIDIAHGGVITTLADIALSLQPYLSEMPHPTVTTTSLTVNFMTAANLGDWLEARATIDRLSKRTAHVHGSIKSGERIVATASGIFGIYRGRPA
jgi:acyl-coenzyme A thioesterase 13